MENPRRESGKEWKIKHEMVIVLFSLDNRSRFVYSLSINARALQIVDRCPFLTGKFTPNMAYKRLKIVCFWVSVFTQIGKFWHTDSGQAQLKRIQLSSGSSSAQHITALTHATYQARSLQAVLWKSYLVMGFPLRCFQRLSLPNLATRRCNWRHNRFTIGLSIPVLSY